MHIFAPSGVSKASNAHLPLIGPVIRSFQNIYVPEGNGAQGEGWDGKPRMNIAALIAQRYSLRCSFVCTVKTVLVCVQSHRCLCV